MRSPCVLILAFLLALGCWIGRASAGTVATDGSLGPQRTLSGPDFTIRARLGEREGDNLFHSFSAFDLDAGETATFTGPSSIQFVFARVTGGQPSSIDGTLSCTMPHATFFLIDPNGVMFGPDAKLDVKGSFAVTTADELKLGSSGSFSASKPHTSVLTTAAPSAFGFLSPPPAGVSVQGATLTVPQGKALSVVSGPVQITHGQLLAPSGGVNLLSTSGTDQVPVVRGSGDAAPPQIGTAPGGQISISDFSLIQTDGDAGGPVEIGGGTLSLNHSTISSNSVGGKAGRGIAMELTGDLSVHGGIVESESEGRGAGGDITVTAANVLLDGFIDRGLLDNPLSTGAGGDVTVHTGFLQILNASLIDVRPYGAGRAGDVTVTASRMVMNSLGTISDTSDTGIDAYAQDNATGHSATGHSGDVQVHTGSLKMIDGGAIIADSINTGGHAGNVSVTAGRFFVDGANTGALTGISADGNPEGAGGDIMVHAASISLIGGATFTSSIFGNANAGNIRVSADRLYMKGNGETGGDITQISVETNPGSTGNAGSLSVDVGDLTLKNGAQILGDTSGSGNSGLMSITAGSIRLVGSDAAPFPTAISSTSNPGATGHAGDLDIDAEKIRVLQGADIAALTYNNAPGGKLNITAGTLIDDGASSVGFTGLATQAGGTKAIGMAGKLTVAANTLTILHGGRISDDTFDRGAGGALTVTAGNLTIDGARTTLVTGIDARSRATAIGAGGDVVVTADILTLRNGGTISAATLGKGRGGNVTVHAASITVDGGANTATITGINSQSEAGATGTAGDVNVTSDSSIYLNNGSISALSAQNGGNVSVTAPLLITLENDSRIISRGLGNGGNIVIDPLELTLATGSTVNANGGDLGGNISIAADALPGVRLNKVLRDRNMTATGSAGVSGSINTGPATNDVARAIAALPTALAGSGLNLEPQCGQMADFSTFLIQGRGGVPAGPGDWQLDFNPTPWPDASQP